MPNLDAEAKEVVTLDLFRNGKRSHYELSKVLGLDRFETDAYLRRHNVVEGFPHNGRPEREGETLDRVFRQVRP